MTGILDACTVINLLLVYNDDRYINLAEKVFNKLCIRTEVFDEIRANKFDNLTDGDLKSHLDSIIYGNLNRFVVGEDNKNASSFIETKLPYGKKNGEFYSSAEAVASSRLGDNEMMENILKVHFITDDEPATDDFAHFFKINVIGQILNSIDLMTVFCLKGLITKGELFRYCQALKFLYNRNAALIIKEIKRIKNDESKSISAKEQLALTTLYEVISEMSDDVIDKTINLLQNQSVKDTVRQYSYLNHVLGDFLKTPSREKIPAINQRVLEFEKVWELDYA